jgi:hypothetical protein
MLATVLILGGVALAGCATPAPSAEPTAPDASTPASATPAAEPPTSEPPAEPTATTCETVLTEAGYADLAADGLEPVEVGRSTFYPIADDLIAAGALWCTWGRPSSDSLVTVVQLSNLDVAASEWPAELAAEGYVETGDPVEGAYTGPADPGTGVPSVVIVTADRLTFVSTPTRASDVAPAG